MGKKHRSSAKDRKKVRDPIRKEGPPRTQDQPRQRYRPDQRRIAAVEIGAKAQKAQNQKHWKAALARYEECNRILQELLEDSKDGVLFDLDCLEEDPHEYRETLRAWCLRSLASNFHFMVECAAEGRFPERVRPYTEKMLEYAHEHDRVCDSQESKMDLVDHYLAAIIPLMGNDSIADPARFLDYVCSCLIHLEDVYGKSGDLKEEDQDLQVKMCANLRFCLNRYPETGDGAMDSLLEAINRSIEVGDVDGFYLLDITLGILYDLMLEKGRFWEGSRISLETLYVQSTNSLIELLLRHEMYDLLRGLGEDLLNRCSSLKTQVNRACAANALANCVDALVKQDKIEEALKATEAVLTCSMGPDGVPTCLPLQWQHRLGRHVALLLQTNRFAEVEETVNRWMKARKETLRTGYTKEYEDIGITKEKYRYSIEEDTAIMLVQLALIAWHRNRLEEVSQCLRRAKDYLETHPKLKQARPDIATSIAEMQKNLPADLADF